MRLRAQVAAALGAMSEPASRGALLAAATRESSDRLAQKMRKAAKGLGRKVPVEKRLKALEKTVEQLQREHRGESKGGDSKAGDSKAGDRTGDDHRRRDRHDSNRKKKKKKKGKD
jgi:hypothetical protein